MVERRRRIRELIMEGKPLTVAFLSSYFGVSATTVRRDLVQLEAEGKLHRTRGGAEPSRTEEYEPSYYIRTKENEEEKAAIGRAAAALVKDGEVIIIDIGTTLICLIHALAHIRELTVLTNWLPNVLELAKHSEVRTVLLGGILRHAELSLVGGMTKDSLGGFYADKAFIGIGGLDAVKGLTDYNIDEVEVKRAIIHAAREVIVLTDHTKLGRVAPVSVAPLSAVHTLVVDQAITEKQYETLRGHGLKILVTNRGDGGGGNLETQGRDGRKSAI